jgi:hypothetical protein
MPNVAMHAVGDDSDTEEYEAGVGDERDHRKVRGFDGRHRRTLGFVASPPRPVQLAECSRARDAAQLHI